MAIVKRRMGLLAIHQLVRFPHNLFRCLLFTFGNPSVGESISSLSYDLGAVLVSP